LRMRMRWWQKTLYYSKKRYRKTPSHHRYHKHTAKGTYFFDYGNAFLLEARAGADIMADNHIDFKYWVTYRISWGPCVLIMVWSFRWVCASGKPEDLKNRYHRLPSARRNGKKQHLLKFSNKCRITFNG
jgi:urocanate hydratase